MGDREQEEPVIKNPPLLTNEELNQKASKKKLFIYFCSLIAVVLVIIAISIIIAVTYGKSSESKKSNTFIAKYITYEEDTSVNLFSFYLINATSSMIIDEKIIYPEDRDNKKRKGL